MDRTSTLAAALVALLAVSATPAAAQASQGCNATNARLNPNRDLKMGMDFVPVVPDDSMGFYVVYSVKYDSTFTAGIYLMPLTGGDVLMFGSGYGDSSLEGAAAEAGAVDRALRGCMSRRPALNRLHFVAPHGHGDHINDSMIAELRALGWAFDEITYHEDDAFLVDGYDWTPQDRAVFRELRGKVCGDELASFTSPLGKIWFTSRSGHTGGSIDLVLDVRDDPTDRLCIRGSVSGGPCNLVPGVQLAIDAHGTVFLPPLDNATRPRVEIKNGTGTNRLCLMTDSAPRIGGRWFAEVLATGHPGATALMLTAYTTGLDNGIQMSAGEFLLDTVGGVYLMQLFQPASQPTFQLDVPNDASFLGYEAWFQGMVLGNGPEFCNALHVKIGI